MKFQPDDTVGYAEFTVNMDVTVKKKEITVPEITGTRTYNGNKQYSGLVNTALYTVTDNGGTKAGDYTATVTLKDPEHYCWKDITEDWKGKSNGIRNSSTDRACIWSGTDAGTYRRSDRRKENVSGR